MTPPKLPPKCWCGWRAPSLRNPAALVIHAASCPVARAAHDAYRQAIARHQPQYAREDAQRAAQAVLDAPEGGLAAMTVTTHPPQSKRAQRGGKELYEVEADSEEEAMANWPDGKIVLSEAATEPVSAKLIED